MKERKKKKEKRQERTKSRDEKTKRETVRLTNRDREGRTPKNEGVVVCTNDIIVASLYFPSIPIFPFSEQMAVKSASLLSVAISRWSRITRNPDA